MRLRRMTRTTLELMLLLTVSLVAFIAGALVHEEWTAQLRRIDAVLVSVQKQQKKNTAILWGNQ